MNPQATEHAHPRVSRLAAWTLAVSVAAIAFGCATRGTPDRDARYSGGDIRVKRTVHIEQPGMLVEATAASLGYVSSTGTALMEVVEFGGQRDYRFTRQGKTNPDVMPEAQIRLSKNNGRTWQTVGQWPAYTPIEGKRRLQRFAPNFVVNPDTGTVLRLYIANEDIEGLLPWAKGAPNTSTRRMLSELSRDGGRTWSKPAQVVVQGAEFNKEHWAPGIWYGKNGAAVEGVTPVPAPDGSFLLPFSAHPMLDGATECSGALIGRWRSDDSGVDWDITSYGTLPGTLSSQGAVEPSLTFLPDGRLYMLVRARVGSKAKAPSCRYYFVSSDMGKTWSDAEPVRYEDGELMYSPACLGHVFRASRNGKCYIITNILEKPSHDCDPRTTLQIAELNPETFRVMRDTVTVIEERDPDLGQPETIRFSNWRRYEDRKTGDIVLLMTACPGDVGRFEECGVPPHSYRYDITVPRK